jgi:hypothetical protein
MSKNIPSSQIIEQTVTAMEGRGFVVEVVSNGKAALEKLKTLIPEGAEITTGSSTSLNEIGFSDYLESGKHAWKNLNTTIWAENDAKARGKLRRLANAAEYFVASVNAVSAEGELVAVDATGSRVGAIPFAAENVILVIGANKITENLEAAIKRIKEVVFPQEDKRALAAYGAGSTFGKWLIVEREVAPGRIIVILVKEALGF